MGNQKSLLQQNKSLKDVIKHIGEKDVLDPCPICNVELFFDETTSKRCAILDANNNVVGWLCPNCKSEFENDDTVVDLFTNLEVKGES